jgi:D-alanine-D-alanine ligase-like ATP-grasp enzyme/acylphosphatase
MNSNEWLSQLKKLVPENAYGATSNMYAIGLEGWKRGLTLKFYKTYVNNKAKVRYSLTYQDREHKFQYSLGDLVPKESRKITKSKEVTKEYLLKANVPTPKGKSFGPDSDNEDIIRFSKSLQYPLVLKPTSSSLGKGVITNISDEASLSDGLKNLRETNGYDHIILEEQASGEDTRVFVVGDQVVSAYKRIPANVIGDGKSSISELIERKNAIRKNNPHASDYKINLDDNMKEFLRQSGLTVDSIPNNGQRVFLSESTLHKLAAETVDITDELTAESKAVAVNAAKALPGMAVCGIDIMIDNDKGTNFVLELNSRPNIGGGLFPLEGQARDLPKAIIDQYFPETISTPTADEMHKFYFDYGKIKETLYSGITEEVIVPPIPSTNLVFKQIVVAKKGQSTVFTKSIHKTAVGLKLNGFAKKQKNRDLQIVVAGEQTQVDLFIKGLQERSPSLSIKEQEWDKPIMVGFHIISPEVKKEKATGTTKVTQLIQQRDQALNKLQKIEQSKSWRYTLPLRKLLKKVKAN